MSEWCRQALLAAVASPAQRPEDEAILSEILALRNIVINLLYGQTAGEPLDEERMRELIEAADAEKLAKALERLQAVRTARAGVLSDDNRGVRQEIGVFTVVIPERFSGPWSAVEDFVEAACELSTQVAVGAA